MSGELILDGLYRDRNTDFALENLLMGRSLNIQNYNIKMLLWSFNFEMECKKDVTIKNSEFDLYG